MSGHSKWSTIKHKKAATDKKRGQQFSKLARAIMVAAKEGGGDPDANAALANAVAKAKSYSLPRENIERAIQKGAGGGEGENFETVIYEGFGPGGAAFVVEALTDNRNRTAANVRSIFTKAGSALGAPGSVAWKFDRKGVVIVENVADEDELLLAAADAGADDSEGEDGIFRVTTEPTALSVVRNALEAAGFEVTSAELTLLPKQLAEIDDEGSRKVLKMVDLLEDDDDVQEVFFDVEITEAVLAEQ
ncbi:MAG: YebC/PmpR family DNA-binding transcriptional regulator [Thermoleophilia bacterium]|nr:YebC/PmpR family DNA-binding transcriptional regulator [Thermoleophilia bacterium]